jgi:hypothetical protein
MAQYVYIKVSENSLEDEAGVGFGESEWGLQWSRIGFTTALTPKATNSQIFMESECFFIRVWPWLKTKMKT